jgi:hypothetical protein
VRSLGWINFDVKSGKSWCFFTWGLNALFLLLAGVHIAFAGFDVKIDPSEGVRSSAVTSFLTSWDIKLSYSELISFLGFVNI